MLNMRDGCMALVSYINIVNKFLGWSIFIRNTNLLFVVSTQFTVF